MTSRKWVWAGWWLIALASVTATCASWQRYPYPSVAHRQVAVPRDSLARFADCMGWDAKVRDRVSKTVIYVGPAPSQWSRFDGVQQHGWLWVRETAEFYPVLYHEWTHVAVPFDPRHKSKAWDLAQSCGATLSWLDRVPFLSPN